MKYLNLFLSTFLIILSFFLWILFSQSKESFLSKQFLNKKEVVSIELKSKVLKVNSSSKNIEIYLNGKLITSEENIKIF